MYMIPVANETNRRPQGAIGSERAARLAAFENLDPGQGNLEPSVPPLADFWRNSGGEEASPELPRVLAAIGSERAARLAALKNLKDKQNIEITEGPQSMEAFMYQIPEANETKRRPQAAIGSERAARLAALENLDACHNMGAQDNVDPNLPLGDYWSNFGGGETPALPRVMAAIGSERAARLAALANLKPRQNSPAAWQSSPSASLQFHDDDDDDDDLMSCVSPADWSYTSLLSGWEKDPLGEVHSRAAPTFPAEAAALVNQQQLVHKPDQMPHPDRNPLPPPAPIQTRTTKLGGLDLLLEKKFESSQPPSLKMDDDDDDDDDNLSFCVNPGAHWSYTSLLAGWQKDPLAEVHPRPSRTFSIFPPEEAAAQALANQQQQLESKHQPEKMPHPETNPLPPPTPTPALTTKSVGLELLFEKSPPPTADSSWLSKIPEWKGKDELRLLPVLPSPIYDEQLLDDIHCVQAQNKRLKERILNQMSNEQSRERFELELLRRQLRNEQQLKNFLEKKLGQGGFTPESQCIWRSWFENGEDTTTTTTGEEGGCSLCYSCTSGAGQ